MGKACCGNKHGHSHDDEPVSNISMTKEEEAIAKFIRFNTPCKKTIFNQNEVDYFTGEKAVTTLYESEKYGCKSKTPMFNDREEAAAYLQTLMERGLFFKVVKTVLRKKDKAKKVNDQNSENKSDDESKKKDKKKVKLTVHQHQSFIDGKETYVWTYNPTPLIKQLIGIGLLVGTVALCLLPLWPEWLRTVVYYVAMAAVGFIVLLMTVAAARSVLFVIIFILTLGKHHLWILPNLTEDCGFFESFVPLYTYEYRGSDYKNKKSIKKDKRSDDEQSDGEDITKDEKDTEDEKNTSSKDEGYVMIEEKN
uniref:Translocation protein SEC62 n=1 Tax=Strongyloides stercoralis TaxID=6248 RepID=A0A0K0EGF1_STRER